MPDQQLQNPKEAARNVLIGEDRDLAMRLPPSRVSSSTTIIHNGLQSPQFPGEDVARQAPASPPQNTLDEEDEVEQGCSAPQYLGSKLLAPKWSVVSPHTHTTTTTHERHDDTTQHDYSGSSLKKVAKKCE